MHKFSPLMWVGILFMFVASSILFIKSHCVRVNEHLQMEWWDRYRGRNSRSTPCPKSAFEGPGGRWDCGTRTLRASAVGGGHGGPGGHHGTSPPPSPRWAPALYYSAAQGGIQGGPGGAIGAPAGVIVPLDGAALGHIVGFAPKLTSPAFQRGL